MTEEHLVHDLLTVDRILERKTDVVVVEGRILGDERRGVMREACHLGNLHIRCGLEVLENLRIHAVDVVHLTTDKRVHAGCRVDDGSHFDGIEPRRAMIVGEALARALHARLELVEHIGAGAVAGECIGLAVLGGQDVQVEVGDQIGEVRIAAIKGEDDGILAVGLDVDQGLQQRLRRGLGIFRR